MTGFKGRVCATEGYPPNVPLAQRRLEPLGAEVYDVADTRRLPFEDSEFDLVMNRHGAFSLTEEFRVLRPGGLFVTQQVGHRSNLEIHDWFGHEKADATELSALETIRPDIQRSGFTFGQSAEAYEVHRYTDVGSLVYYLKCISWEIPDFSVDRYGDELLSLHRQMCTTRIPFQASIHLYYLGLQKPGGDNELIL